MGWKLQISVADLAEMLRPALFVLAALFSALVLADARRRFSAYAVAAWTLLTLLFPPIILPLYLIARIYTRRANSHDTTAETTKDVTDTQSSVESVVAESTSETAALSSSSIALPLVYIAAVLLFGALYFYRDYTSFDAHFAAARRANLYNQRERAIHEYRAALRLRDDAHTHKLLGLELAGAGLWEEALTEFRAAQRGGEPDERLIFHEAVALDKLNRPAEAINAYRLFFQSRLCTSAELAPLCDKAQFRLATLTTMP